MSVDGTDLEADIVSQFLENIASNPGVSEETVEILNDVSNETDFGGRDYLKETILEVKGRDED